MVPCLSQTASCDLSLLRLLFCSLLIVTPYVASCTNMSSMDRVLSLARQLRRVLTILCSLTLPLESTVLLHEGVLRAHAFSSFTFDSWLFGSAIRS
jgi:hypothetical protein